MITGRNSGRSAGATNWSSRLPGADHLRALKSFVFASRCRLVYPGWSPTCYTISPVVGFLLSALAAHLASPAEQHRQRNNSLDAPRHGVPDKDALAPWTVFPLRCHRASGDPGSGLSRSAASDYYVALLARDSQTRLLPCRLQPLLLYPPADSMQALMSCCR